MKFDSTSALANHQKKFCTDGDYGTKAKLDQKLKSAISPPTVGDGLTTIGNNKSKVGINKDKDDDKAYIRALVDVDRNKEMAIELEKYKEERRKLKLESMSKEGEYMQK